MKERISSLQNPLVKQLVKLREKSSERRKQGLFLIEGRREIEMAREGGVKFHTVFLCPELCGERLPEGWKALSENELLLPGDRQPSSCQELSLPVFEKIAYRGGSDGLLVLAKTREQSLNALRLSKNPLIIILEAVEKPGNLGAVLRTADAAKADAVIVCDPRTDLFNPNVIRSSLGCLFTTQVVAASSDETISWLKAHNIKSFAAALTASDFFHQSDFSAPSAIVMGTESTGLTGKWLQGADAAVKIPMRGRIDSLNVSTSCAILVFEAMRQRNFETPGEI